MLLGHESTCSPSLDAVAPMPPLKNSTVVYGRPSSRTPDWASAQSGEPAAAATPPRIAWWAAPRSMIGTEEPVFARLTRAARNLRVAVQPPGPAPPTPRSTVAL